MQPCKTGDQPYSDASPYSECSLMLDVRHNTIKTVNIQPLIFNILSYAVFYSNNFKSCK